jgi:hypothetical protein
MGRAFSIWGCWLVSAAGEPDVERKRAWCLGNLSARVNSCPSQHTLEAEFSLVVQFDPPQGCDAREIPRPAGENAGLRDDARSR